MANNNSTATGKNKGKQELADALCALLETYGTTAVLELLAEGTTTLAMIAHTPREEKKIMTAAADLVGAARVLITFEEREVDAMDLHGAIQMSLEAEEDLAEYDAQAARHNDADAVVATLCAEDLAAAAKELS